MGIGWGVGGEGGNTAGIDLARCFRMPQNSKLPEQFLRKIFRVVSQLL